MPDGKPEYNWYRPAENRFAVDEFLAKECERFGPVDMNHFFDWRRQ